MSPALSPPQLDLLQRCSKDEAAFAELCTFAASLLADTTETTRLTHALQDSERRYHDLLESLPIPVVVMDAENFRLLFANAVTRNLFDTPLPDTRFDQFWQAHLSPAEQTLSRERFMQLQQGENLPPAEYHVHLQHEERIVVNEARQTSYAGRPAIISILTDITKHKQTEEALRESEERYRNISEIGADYAFEFNIHPDGRVERVWLTEAFERITGFTRDESAQRGGWLALGHPDDQPYMIEEMKAILSTPGDRTSEYRIVTKSGEVRHIWGHGRSVADATGRIVKLYGVAQDVTDLKRIEQTLAERERFIQQVADTAPCIITVFDLPTNAHVYANRYTSDFVGLPHELIKSQPRDLFKDAFHPDDQSALMRFIETVMQAKDGEVHQAEIRIRRHDGEWRWFINHNIVFERDESGAIKSVISVMVDITKQRHAEQVLAERERFIQRITDTAPGMITVYDVQASKNLYVNRYTADFVGLPQDFAMNRQMDLIDESFHPDDVPTLIQFVETLKVAQDGEVHQAEVRIRRHDGVWRWFRFYDMVFDRDATGAVQSVVAVTIDITEQRHTEQVLQERERFIQRITDTAPCMITVYDLQAKSHVYANRYAAEFVGVPHAAVITPPHNLFHEAFHPNDVPALAQFTEQLRQAGDGEVHQLEARIRRQDGEWRWFRLHDMVFDRDAQGEVNSVIAIIIDITEQRHAEERLKERERFIQRVTDTAPCMITVFDFYAQHTLYANRYATEFLGLAHDYVATHPMDLLKDSFHPDDKLEVMHYVEILKAAQDGVVTSTELRLRRHDGVWRWFHFHDMVFERDTTGGVKSVIAVIMDITEQRHAEEMLQERERFIQQITDAAPCMIAVYDLHAQNNLYINRYAADYLGIPHDVARSGSITLPPETFHPDDTAERGRFAQQAHLAQDGTVYESEMRIRRHDGVWRWFRWHDRVFERDATGGVKLIVTILIDITEVRQAKDALQERERFIQKVSDTAPCMITVYDLEKAKNIYVNRYTAEFMGIPFHNLQNRAIDPDDKFFHPEDRARMLAFGAAMQNAEEGDVYETEIRVQRHDNVWRWFRWYNVLFERNAAGKVKSVISILIDVTDQKAAQDALIEQERLRVELGKEHELSLLKTKMMQRISHEFRTPLAVIISSSYLLQYPNLPEDKRRHQFNTVQTQIARITAMLEDIQVILNRETELVEFYPLALDFREVVDAAFEKVQTTHLHPRTLDLHIAAPLHEAIVVDERLLRLILINLISNALKFSAPETPVTLKAEVAEGHLQFSVQDKGIGIPPEDSQRIFEPFYRASNFDERPGLGLGLTIVKNAVELHNGTIGVTSNSETGTTFTVRLPLGKA